MAAAAVPASAPARWWLQFAAEPSPAAGGGTGERVAAWWRRRPWLTDAALVLAMALVAVPQLRYWAGRPEGGFGIRLLLTVALLAPLAVRRRYPVGAFLAASAVALLQWSLDVTLAADVVLLVYLATVASRYRLRVALAAAAVLEAGVLMASARWDFAASLDLSWAESVVLLSAPVAAALLLGVALRARRQRIQALVGRAEQLERARIARELHDVVAHSLAVMVTMTDAARLKLVRDPDAARSALEQVSRTGRESLDEMRRLLGVLRTTDGTDGHEVLGLRQLGVLAAAVSSAGLPVRLDVVGDTSSVPRGPDVAAYRIVQESLTNALKHATSATHAAVRVEVRDDAVELSVADDGNTTAGAGHGFGVAGMRERAALYGGSLEAGPTGSGWQVRARIPFAPGGPA
jgi:signal transduction histidine kinase